MSRATGEEHSLVVFESHLSPWEACVNLNFANERLSNDFVAACTRDHLTLLTLIRTGEPFDFLLNRARELGQRLIDAHALYCLSNAHLLEVDSTIWLEVKGVTRADAVTGYMHRSLGRVQLDSDHADNPAMHDAAALVRAWGNDPALALALSDFRAARREPGPYYAFHAFRVLEDIRDAFPGKKGAQRWDAMNAALGTTADTWSELTDASTRARHLHPANIAWLSDPSRHGRLMSQTRDALHAFIGHLPILRAPESAVTAQP